MLAIENVSFAYGRGRRVLDGVSLRVGAGEFAAVLGANGAGKSSLLKIASGYARPDVGRVMLGGADIAGLSARELARMRAVLEQECPLTFEYTVGEVVALGGYSRGGLSGLSADVSESLESVGLRVSKNGNIRSFRAAKNGACTSPRAVPTGRKSQTAAARRAFGGA